MEDIALNKGKSLVNLANSILKHFGCKTYHDSIPEIDKIIKESKKEKICLFLFDAFGKSILENYKDVAPFMYNHKFLEIESVFPPTTVACTTSVSTGKYPIETGYLGWTQYFKSLDKFVDVFPSTEKDESSFDNSTKRVGVNIQETILKTRYIFDDINEKYGKEVSRSVQSFNYKKEGMSIEQVNNAWAKEVDKSISENLYTYAYNVYPDSLMHDYGVNDKHVKNVIIWINKTIENIVKKHPDTLFLCISDHGMIDVKQFNIENIPGFVDTLQRPVIAIEGRFASFFVKDKGKFLEIYKHNPLLNEHFLLLSRDEILNKHYFGYSENIHPVSLETIGDYTLISVDEYSLMDKFTCQHHFKGAHAGLSKQEREIYLQAYNIE